jgi:hypothetical protein
LNQIKNFDKFISAKRITGREEFHRQIFELLMDRSWQQQSYSLLPANEASLLSALTRWVVEAPVQDEFGVLRLLVVRRPLHTLIRATGISVRTFIVSALSLDSDDSHYLDQLPLWKKTKLAALSDASILSLEVLTAWNSSIPAIARLAAIAALDTCPIDGKLAEACANTGAWLESLPPADLPLRYLEQLQQSAFFVSYLATPERHTYKRTIVRQAKYILRGLDLPEQRIEIKNSNTRLKLTIVGELMFPLHAMFRCYAESLSGLKSNFHVTLVADEFTRCPEHTTISHDQVYFSPRERNVLPLVQVIYSTHPDIILYPSIGMSYWTFTLSLLRLAPLQLMSVGHPAPSCSDEIDGTLIYRGLLASTLTEYGKLITYEKQPLPLPPKGWQFQQAHPSVSPVISINAAQMKLSPKFLKVVSRILELSPQNTQLQFFPNACGAEFLGLRRELQSQFSMATIYPIMPYAEYMNALSKSSVILQSFPFGGTNTTIDAMELGIPIVCMNNDDLSSAVDPLLLRKSGLAFLCAANEDEYVSIVQKLLSNPEDLNSAFELSKLALNKLHSEVDLEGKSMSDAILDYWKTKAE